MMIGLNITVGVKRRGRSLVLLSYRGLSNGQMWSYKYEIFFVFCLYMYSYYCFYCVIIIGMAWVGHVFRHIVSPFK